MNLFLQGHLIANRFRRALLAALVLLSALAAAARGEDLDEVNRSLGLSDDEPAAVSRLPRPASLIAENVTVIGADQIARLNAHTVADVLQTVPGFQVDVLQTPGGISFYELGGSTHRHILVQIDGVPQNFISAENLAHIGSIPVQMVERIEIVKGASSAAWGSALGGVINIVTKLPSQDSAATGLASASIGKNATSDLRGEISGSGERLGYYLTGGKIHSDGLVPGNATDFNHGFGKLSYEFPNGGRAVLGLDARYNDTGIGKYPAYGIFDTGLVRYLNGYLSLKYPLAERLSLEASARGGERKTEDRRALLSDGSLFFDAKDRELYQGYTAVLSWGDALKALKGGVEYEQTGVTLREDIQHLPNVDTDTTLTRYSAFLNGTYSWGRLSVLPGARFDRFNLLDDAVSCTLGATFRLTDGILLRGYAARGYSMPLITYYGSVDGQVQHKLQQIRTVQGGFETTAIPYLWLKAMLFDNDIWDIQNFDPSTQILNLDRQRRHGVDLEFRTTSWHGFTLSGGYTFTDAYDRNTGKTLEGGESGPRHSVKGALTYDSRDLGLTCVLTGDYSKWHYTLPGADATGTFLDLHVTQKLFPGSETSPEVFFSARNLLDNKYYEYDFHPPAPRWFEVGGRFRF